MGLVSGHDWGEGEFAQWVRDRNVACSTVHSPRCQCDGRFWVELESLDDLGRF